MKIVHTISEYRVWRQNVAGSIPFVPTMGALHDGHASLLRAARSKADSAMPKGAVVASIFVNPTQFGPREDFNKYPRTLDADATLLTNAGCDLLFAPSAEDMYPGIKQLNTQHAAGETSIYPGPLGDVLEGAVRPGHFRGVCTVVVKLLNIIMPTHLFLGQKDFQQQLILTRMCAELNFPVDVVTCPTLREPDGLAMSSRNRYLSPVDRPLAAALYEALNAARHAFQHGERRSAELESMLRTHIERAKVEVQYAVVRMSHTLAPFAGDIDAPAVALVAAKLGTTRLIDNVLL